MIKETVSVELIDPQTGDYVSPKDVGLSSESLVPYCDEYVAIRDGRVDCCCRERLSDLVDDVHISAHVLFVHGIVSRTSFRHMVTPELAQQETYVVDDSRPWNKLHDGPTVKGTPHFLPQEIEQLYQDTAAEDAVAHLM